MFKNGGQGKERIISRLGKQWVAKKHVVRPLSWRGGKKVELVDHLKKTKVGKKKHKRNRSKAKTNTTGGGRGSGSKKIWGEGVARNRLQNRRERAFPKKKNRESTASQGQTKAKIKGGKTKNGNVAPVRQHGGVVSETPIRRLRKQKREGVGRGERRKKASEWAKKKGPKTPDISSATIVGSFTGHGGGRETKLARGG